MKDWALELLTRAKPWFLGMIPASICWIISFLISGESDVTIIFMSVALILGIIVMAHLMLIILPIIPFTFWIIGIGIGKLLRKGLQIDKRDFEKNKEYYRELLNNNTPLVLGYLDNLEFEKRDMIAEVLFFVKKDIIKIEDGMLIKNEGLAHFNLKDSELKILEKIDSGKLTMNRAFFSELRELVAREAESLGLICEKKSKTKNKEEKAKAKARWWLALYLLIVLLGLVSAFVEQLKEIFVICLATWIIVPIIHFFTIYIFKAGYQMGLSKIYKKTSKGYEVKRKLKGLELFLKDYSQIDEREAKEVKLWEEYLVYSVMFGQNKKVIKEFEKYIEIVK